MSEELVPHSSPAETDFELDQRRAKAYFESGYWPDAASIAKALVKIEAGRTLGLPPLIAMSEVHVIEGKPSLGAGALASLVKTSGRYDYEVVALTSQQCTILFRDRGKTIGDSTFTMEDAKTAGLLNRGPWKQYPRNMLFARAMSNGVAWFCPDVTSGRMYVPEELTDDGPREPVDLVVHDIDMQQAEWIDPNQTTIEDAELQDADMEFPPIPPPARWMRKRWRETPAARSVLRRRWRSDGLPPRRVRRDRRRHQAAVQLPIRVRAVRRIGVLRSLQPRR